MIISNCESSPFVVSHAGDGYGTSLSVIDSSYTSSSSSTLLPLGMMLPSPQSSSAETTDDHWVTPLAIRSVSLSLSNTRLVVGTGPLFDFGIVSSSVELSTNHFFGTTIVDMNVGGDLLCSNSSFRHCHSSLIPSSTHPTYILQHRSLSETHYIFDSSTPSSAIVFQRCTFHSMFAHEFDCIITLLYTPSSLAISECSFAEIQTSCSVGGIISFVHSTPLAPFSIEGCSFLKCSALATGGCVHVNSSTTATASSCYLENIKGVYSSITGGGFFFAQVPHTHVSNSVFDECGGKPVRGIGSGVAFMLVPSLKLDSLRFRTQNAPNCSDVHFERSGTLGTLLPNVTNCDSTAMSPRCIIENYPVSETADILIPQPASNRTLRSIQTSLEDDGISATLLATTSGAVKGTMLVLVDNSANFESRDDSSPPAIQRLLSFPFPSLATTSSLTVTCGDWEVLQLGQTYSIIGSSINGTNLSSSSPTFDTPNPSRIVAIVCRSGTALNHAWLGLVGRGVDAGTYTFEIVGIDDFVVSVYFDGSTEVGTQNMFSTEVSVSLFGEGSKFSPNEQYEVNKVTKEGSNEPVFLCPSRLLFTTPNPPRLTEIGEVKFTDEKNETVEIPLIGAELPDSSYTLVVSSSTGAQVPLTAVFSDSSNGKATAVVSSSDGSGVDLLLGESYSIISLTNTDDTLIWLAPLSFTVPSIHLVSSVVLLPNSIHTSVAIELEGKGLKLDGMFEVVLSPQFSLLMMFDDPTTVLSPPILLGRENTLNFSTKYSLVSITRVGTSEEIRVADAVSFTTPSRPRCVRLWVEKNGDTSLFCGGDTLPCCSIDLAWSIGSFLKATQITLEVIAAANQTSPIVVSSGMSVLFSNGSNSEPTIRFPQSASMGEEKGMIVVRSGILTLDDVTIVIETTSPSFVFVFGSESTIHFKFGSLIGTSSTVSSSNDETDDVCWWESGIIQTENCTTTLDTMKLSHLSQGAVRMKNGSLTIETSSFHDNTPLSSSFPSLRRNIVCSDGGTIEVGSLSGGDGHLAGSSTWIQIDDCAVTSTVVNPKASFFIPTLNENETSVGKKTNSFEVKIVGEQMVGCGLGLTISEWDEKTNKTQNSTTLDILSLNPSTFTEASIALTLSRSTLTSKLNETFEWRVRLSFGQNQTTDEWFVLKKSLAGEKKAQSLEQAKKVLPWLLPVVIVAALAIVAIVLILCCLARRKNQNGDTSEMEDDENEVEEKEEDMNGVSRSVLNKAGTDRIVQHNMPTSINSAQLGHTGNEEVEQETTLLPGLMELREGLRCDGEKISIETVHKNDTLFNRIHNDKERPLNRDRLFASIVSGLAQIARQKPQLPILTRLTPHWIFLDFQDQPIFVHNEVNTQSKQEVNPEPVANCLRESNVASLNDNAVHSSDNISILPSQQANSSEVPKQMKGSDGWHQKWQRRRQV
ncbi:hypothetical protein BLNAU_10067 [Blattamonas nauphoetae]|uniref:Uncharacterized protein n=1 Tax=Blattamonas nauphoetae TaxID=2049346 RepID=A0ABQ9XTX2_9EUKA|nr:hypothetical protein BLNAU_10067 [Blattamonas nauphoetae]